MTMHRYAHRVLAGTLLMLTACLPILSRAGETLPSSASFALDGMAPEGRWAARWTQLRNGYDKRYGPDRQRTDLDAPFDGMDLGALGLAGTLKLDTKVITEYSELMFGYGVTRDLTVGAIIPYVRTTHCVDYSVNGGIGTAGMNAVLSGVLGYKPIRTTRVEGFGDPTFGALWRFHRGERDSAIFGAGVRVGIAKRDDPDDLMDIPIDDGSTDLRARLEYFRDLGGGFDLHLLGEYFHQTADHATLRPGNPLTTVNKERLDRKLGDYWETDIELGKTFGDWRVSATWHRYRKYVDHYRSDLGSDTSYLNANTDTLADQYRLSIGWSGVNAWREGRLPLPLVLRLEMQDAFRGRNFVDVRDIYLRVITFF